MERLKAEELVRDALGQLRLALHPPPRIHGIKHSDGTIVVVGVPRTEGTVFCFENQQRVYYARLHDSTAFAPAYLVAVA